MSHRGQVKIYAMGRRKKCQKLVMILTMAAWHGVEARLCISAQNAVATYQPI